MFKPLPKDTTGYITEAASRIATVLTVNDVLYNRIAALVEEDWTYLHIMSAGKIEIVKVVTALGDNKIHVLRGIEGTDREPILANTKAYYALCVSALYDQVRTQVAPITLTSTGVVRSNPLYVPVVQIKTNAAIEATARWTISDGNYDPCKPYHCAGYQFGPFYYTSKLYPYELVEGMRGGPAPEPHTWRLSPGATDAMSSTVATIYIGTLRAQVQEYHGWTSGSTSEDDPNGDSGGPGEWMESTVASIALGTLRAQIQTYTHWMDTYNGYKTECILSTVASVSGGTIKRILITYDNWIDTYNGYKQECILASSATIASGTLT